MFSIFISSSHTLEPQLCCPDSATLAHVSFTLLPVAGMVAVDFPVEYLNSQNYFSCKLGPLENKLRAT